MCGVSGEATVKGEAGLGWGEMKRDGWGGEGGRNQGGGGGSIHCLPSSLTPKDYLILSPTP